ncbi:restriction endonuclease subunit S [Rummeliibacillus suwonensis]|uniref:restriction endonuclease subunit S n=1 Tax=Rummeliibacillus suwonensis TaxID=1306154 RepID=UPI0011B6C112|nr:restriction endonuclease subunit S [Rummeliibacillus suwonensis]
MSENSKKEPKLRFPGFTDAWEQRKFSDVVDVRSGRDYKHLNEGNVPVYGTGGYMLSVDEALSYDEDAIGIGRKGTIDKPYLLKAPFWTVDTLFYAVPNKGFNLDFVNSIFQRVNWKKYDESTGVPSLSKTVINKVPVIVPSEDEQVKIGTFFANLDHLITLHQRKLSDVQNLKAGLLQKMFPKNDANVPEIRFPGFTDVWEQRKLSAVASYRNGKAHEKDISDSGDFVVVNSKFVSTSGRIKKYTNKQIEPLEKDEIAFVLSDVPNGKAIAKTFLVPENNKYSLNQRIAGITPYDNTDPYFLSELMNRHHYFLRFDDGVGQTNLSKKDVEDFEEFYPAVEEQRKIGQFFKRVDHLITLHQRKLEHLQEQKKSLLQQMFV